MQIETDRGADAANAPPCPETAAEQRAALRRKIETGPLGEEIRQHARTVFTIAHRQPPALAIAFRARQLGEAIGAERERLRRELPGNPAVDVIAELYEELWSAAYDAAERAFDADPTEIAAAREANAASWRALEASIRDCAARAYDDLKIIEAAETARGADKPICVAFARGLALGKMLGTLRSNLSDDGNLDLDAVEENATAIFNSTLDDLARLDVAEPAGAA